MLPRRLAAITETPLGTVRWPAPVAARRWLRRLRRRRWLRFHAPVHACSEGRWLQRAGGCSAPVADTMHVAASLTCSPSAVKSTAAAGSSGSDVQHAPGRRATWLRPVEAAETSAAAPRCSRGPGTSDRAGGTASRPPPAAHAAVRRPRATPMSRATSTQVNWAVALVRNRSSSTPSLNKKDLGECRLLLARLGCAGASCLSRAGCVL